MNISATRLRWLYIRGAFWWTGLAFAAIGAVLLLIDYSLWQSEQGFEANSTPAGAVVTRKTTRTTMGGKQGKTPTTHHVLVYSFQDGAGQEHEGNDQVSLDAWTQAKKGDALTIEYDRTNPASSRLAGGISTARWGLMATGGVGVVFATVGITIVACLLIRSGQRVRLVKNGSPAIGIVDAVVENDSALKVSGTYRVTYHFTDPSGSTLQGRGPPQPYSLAYRWNPGDTVLVLYDPRNPNRNEADLFETRSDEFARLEDEADANAATE